MANSQPKKPKVLVAMSGGVDSAVAAALLQDQGYEVVGCFMRLGSEDRAEPADQCDPAQLKPHHQGCCSLNDAADARVVAAKLDVPLYVLNFKGDFGRIIDYFVGEYNAGRTPNPCVRCNDWLKFGKLADYAQSIGADYVATGHHARVDHSGSIPRLLMGKDPHKDQSYVLFGSPMDRLSHMLLPIGELDKHEVRRIALQRGLPVHDKPDSQEICFVPDNNYFRLVNDRTPEQVAAGEVLNQSGTVVGTHDGHQRYTIGQRRGVGVALGYPIYVVDKDPTANTVTVGRRDELLSDRLSADQTNWMIDTPATPMRCTAKIRYNSPPVPAQVVATGDDTMDVQFDLPQSAVTPGQAVVCYVGEHVIGGGWISTATKSTNPAHTPTTASSAP